MPFLYGKGTFNGLYPLMGDMENAKLVVAHEFAVRHVGNGRFHEAMAQLIADDERLMFLPKKLNRFVANALFERRPELNVEVFTGESSGSMGGGEGTKGEISQTKQFMLDTFGEIVPSVHIGHARHIGRIIMQAQAQGLQPITIAGYPDGFDPTSDQLHTRNALVWGAHELIGVPVLHMTRQF